MRKYLIMILCLSFLLTACGNSETGSSGGGEEDSALCSRIEAVLYFGDESGTGLAVEERQLILSETESPAEAIVKALVEGPNEKTHEATIPKETVVNDVKVVDGICYVDLSSEFQLNHPGTEILEQLTVYSLVDSLTERVDIEKVVILIDGEKKEYLKTYVRLDRFLERDLSFVKP